MNHRSRRRTTQEASRLASRRCHLISDDDQFTAIVVTRDLHRVIVNISPQLTRSYLSSDPLTLVDVPLINHSPSYQAVDPLPDTS